MSNHYHVPVMATEVLEALNPQPGQIFVDATLGGGGHASLVAERLGRTGALIGIDQDPEAIVSATQTLAGLENGPRFATAQARFDGLTEALAQQGATQVDGILFDLGVSSHQLDEPRRGFSFKDPNARLDMRMNPDSGGMDAAALLNGLDEAQLARIFRDYADERWAMRIANFVVEQRAGQAFEYVGQLIDTVLAAVPVAARTKGIHPATRVFQALRIAVNDEYPVLDRGLRQGVEALRQGGIIAVLSYHSGEDRIVKRLFAHLAGQCECPTAQPVCTCGASAPELDLVTKKPLTPSAEEIGSNPRARSAKLRIARKRSLEIRGKIAAIYSNSLL